MAFFPAWIFWQKFNDETEWKLDHLLIHLVVHLELWACFCFEVSHFRLSSSFDRDVEVFDNLLFSSRGAMENKSLNVRPFFAFFINSIYFVVWSDLIFLVLPQNFWQIFNSKLVLASPETATDGDYAAILGVIGHEVGFRRVVGEWHFIFSYRNSEFILNHMTWLLCLFFAVFPQLDGQQVGSFSHGTSFYIFLFGG